MHSFASSKTIAPPLFLKTIRKSVCDMMNTEGAGRIAVRLVVVLVEVAFVVHAEPGVQTSTGRVNPEISGRS